MYMFSKMFMYMYMYMYKNTTGVPKCRKSYPAPITTRAPFTGVTDITCRGKDQEAKGSMTHIGTLDGCNRQVRPRI